MNIFISMDSPWLDWVYEVDIRFKESLLVIRYCLYFGLGYYKSPAPPTTTIPSYWVMDGHHPYVFTRIQSKDPLRLQTVREDTANLQHLLIWGPLGQISHLLHCPETETLLRLFCPPDFRFGYCGFSVRVHGQSSSLHIKYQGGSWEVCFSLDTLL